MFLLEMVTKMAAVDRNDANAAEFKRCTTEEFCGLKH